VGLLKSNSRNVPLLASHKISTVQNQFKNESTGNLENPPVIVLETQEDKRFQQNFFKDKFHVKGVFKNPTIA
jgi:hypothetical protein